MAILKILGGAAASPAPPPASYAYGATTFLNLCLQSCHNHARSTTSTVLFLHQRHLINSLIIATTKAPILIMLSRKIPIYQLPFNQLPIITRYNILQIIFPFH